MPAAGLGAPWPRPAGLAVGTLSCLPPGSGWSAGSRRRSISAKALTPLPRAFDRENLSIADKVTGQQRIAPQHEHRALPALGDLAAPNNAAVLLQHRPRLHQGDGLAVPERQRDLRANTVGRRARVACARHGGRLGDFVDDGGRASVDPLARRLAPASWASRRQRGPMPSTSGAGPQASCGDGLLCTAKATRFIFWVKAGPTGAFSRAGAHQHRPAEGRYRGKTGSGGFTGPQAPSNRLAQAQGGAAPSPQMRPSPGVNRY